MTSKPKARLLLGRIADAHGLRGEVLVKSFTGEPADIAAYGSLTDAAGTRRFQIQVVRVTARGVIARVKGVADRTAAEALKGVELFVERERLPKAAADEYYHADLIGLAAVSPAGEAVGEVVAVQNYGAGDLIEVRLAATGRTELVPFSSPFVPEVDIDAGRIVIVMPVAAGGDDDEDDDRDPG